MGRIWALLAVLVGAVIGVVGLTVGTSFAWHAESACDSGKWKLTYPNADWAEGDATFTWNAGAPDSGVAPGKSRTAPDAATSVVVTWAGTDEHPSYTRPQGCVVETTTTTVTESLTTVAATTTTTLAPTTTTVPATTTTLADTTTSSNETTTSVVASDVPTTSVAPPATTSPPSSVSPHASSTVQALPSTGAASMTIVWWATVFTLAGVSVVTSLRRWARRTR